MFDETINNVLNKYNIAKDDFISGLTSEEEYKDVFNRLNKLLSGAISLIDVRVAIIDEKVNKNFSLTKEETEDLLYEKNWLTEDAKWYSALRDATTNEYYNLIAGDFDLCEDDELSDEEME